MFTLPEAWVWDFWLVDDGTKHHMFFLYASKAIKDPEARHFRASIGHAVSTDLTTWTRVNDALVRSDAPAFDDLATWTGSVVRHPDGTWFMFYTGTTTAPGAKGANIQRIGYATSQDLMSWDKNPGGAILEADPRWYERLSDGGWHDEAFRDPWVLADPRGDGWHMLITARANHGPADDRGVIGHATSPDLRTWTLQPPLSEPGQGFGQLEVVEPVVVDGRSLLVFNCLGPDTSLSRQARGTTGGVWLAPAESALGPYGLAGAYQLTDNDLYVGRLIKDRATGALKFLAFANVDQDGGFVGEIIDPRDVTWADGRLVLNKEADSSSSVAPDKAAAP